METASVHAASRRFRQCRELTERLCAGLRPEDFVIQAEPEASPPKWHLAHTTWFFERFVLREFDRRYRAHHPAYDHLFNSYYEAVGPYFPRERRGTLSRPTVEEIRNYRALVTARVLELLECDPGIPLLARVELGIHHEQQHQELLLTDILRNFAANPLRPAAYETVGKGPDQAESRGESSWIELREKTVPVGHDGEGFAFDNERPAHRVHLSRARLASRLVTSGEFLEFMEAGGYRRPELWLADGWRWVRTGGIEAPLYWERSGADWWQMTLRGMRRVKEASPVAHLSYYEADAFARWREARLPTEFEWESVARGEEIRGNLLESLALDVAPAPERPGPVQLYGDVWEWTRSAYLPYPGFRPEAGALGEYNGKFMCGQMVLRGGSCVTPASHIRATYRNFFGPDARWQFTGMRLALD